MLESGLWLNPGFIGLVGASLSAIGVIVAKNIKKKRNDQKTVEADASANTTQHVIPATIDSVRNLMMASSDAKVKEADAKVKEAEAKVKEAEAATKEAEARAKDSETKRLNDKAFFDNVAKLRKQFSGMPPELAMNLVAAVHNQGYGEVVLAKLNPPVE